MVFNEKLSRRLLGACFLFPFAILAATCAPQGSNDASADDALSNLLIGTALIGGPWSGNHSPGTDTTAFHDVGDGTVVSVADSLMWAKCHQGTGSTNLFTDSGFCSGTRGEFQFCNQNGDCNANGSLNKITLPYANGATSPAYASCDGLNLGGKTDWRLPTRQELARFFYNLYLNDITSPRAFPNAYKSGVPDSVDNFNWSTSGTGDSTSAWGMSGFNGEITSRIQSNAFYVRCVRDNI